MYHVLLGWPIASLDEIFHRWLVWINAIAAEDYPNLIALNSTFIDSFYRIETAWQEIRGVFGQTVNSLHDMYPKFVRVA